MGDATHELVATAMTDPQRTPIDRKFCGFMSVSRSLQIIAVGLLLLIIVATVHQLMTLRAAIVSDTARQMARLDMVFAEQTGRAIETVDFIVRNVIETLHAERAVGAPTTASFDALLGRRIDGVRQLTELAITDASGHVLYASQPGPDRLPEQGMAALAFHIANPTDWTADQSAIPWARPQMDRIADARDRRLRPRCDRHRRCVSQSRVF